MHALIASWLADDAERIVDAREHITDALVLAAAYRAAVVRQLHEHNQFAVVARGTEQALEQSALETWQAVMQASDVKAVHDALAGSRVVREQLVGSAMPSVTCGLYAATLQLDILGLEAANLLEPIVDVGCGPGAVLVRALRAQGRNAVGIDRHLDIPTEWAREVDFLVEPLATESYGTIVSHLALSLHFLHHHAAGKISLARTLAAVWAQLTQSLVPGGCFAYAPGLPMLERALDRKLFEVARVALPTELDATFSQLSAAVGENVSYSAQVRRRLS